MSTTLQLYQYFAVTIDGVRYESGSLTKPTTKSLTGLIRPVIKQVPTLETRELFDIVDDANETGGYIPDWDLFWCQSDYDVMLELVCDVGNSVGRVAATVEVDGSGTANVMGPALVLPSNVAMANHTLNFATGTADVIDMIRVKNRGTSTATVKAWILT